MISDAVVTSVYKDWCTVWVRHLKSNSHWTTYWSYWIWI